MTDKEAAKRYFEQSKSDCQRVTFVGNINGQYHVSIDGGCIAFIFTDDGVELDVDPRIKEIEGNDE